MVGHTGDMDAAIAAIEALDQCLERVTNALVAQGGQCLITADHGNAELMKDPVNGSPVTAHTTFPVPLVWVSENAKGKTLDSGRLCDIAPTLLALMGIEQPKEMTGVSLLNS